MHIINLLYSISGFSVGMLVGMTGVGGGALMTPLLILLFGIHPAIAVGSDLLYAAITKTGGSLIHGISGTIEWRVVGRLACGSVPMTAVTLFLLSKLDLTDSTASGLITVVLSGTLFFTAAVLILRQKIVAHFATRSSSLAGNLCSNVCRLMNSLARWLMSASWFMTPSHREACCRPPRRVAPPEQVLRHSGA